MKLQYFNPLRHVFKFKSAPHAITLRTTFGRKWLNSLEAIGGKDLHADDGHLGIFDWLTLGIPAGIEIAYAKLSRLAAENKAYWVLKAPLALIHVPLKIARLATALLLSLVSLLITAIVHLVSTYFANKEFKLISETPIVYKQYGYHRNASKFSAYRGNLFTLAENNNEGFALAIKSLGGRLDQENFLHPNATQLESMYKLNLFDIANKLDSNHFTLLFKKNGDGQITDVEAFHEADKKIYNVILPDAINLQELPETINSSYITFAPR